MSDDRLSRLRTRYDLPRGYLSPSQISMYSRCPACYELRYVRNLPSAVNADLIVGHAAHAAMQHFREMALIPGAVQPSDPPNLYGYAEIAADSFDAEVKQAQDRESGTELIIDLGSKFKTIGEAKDMAVAMTNFAIPIISEYDLPAEIEAVENRVWGLGTPMDPEEREHMTKYHLAPVFPFKFWAQFDVLYKNDTLKDTKTVGRRARPDYLTAIAVSLYRLPYSRAGIEMAVGIDQFLKRKGSEKEPYGDRERDYAQWWLGITPEREQRAIEFVLEVADAISRGYFPARPGWWCNWSHDLPEFKAPVEMASGADTTRSP